jgi:putative ABC transport system permease protein
MFANLWFDLKYAWRLTLKSPGHSLLCAVVVALSVGLTLWAWVLVYAMALKPWTFPGSDRWLSLQVAANATASSVPDIDAYTYQEIRKQTRTVDYLGAFASRTAVLSEGQASTSLRAGAITPSLLAAAHVTPLVGRLFEPSEGEPGAAATALLSYDTWQSYFAGDRAIVGKRARIDGKPVQIIGVMPQDFFFASQDFEVLLPLQPALLAKPAEPGAGSNASVSAFIVLNGDQSPGVLLSEMQPAVDTVNRNYPKLFNAQRHVELVPAHLTMTHGLISMLTMISFVALAVLLLGCVNISLVFFARLLERSREMALRTALGSSRSRLLRQALLESVFIMLLGLLLGIGLTALGVDFVRSLSDFLSQYLANGRDADPVTIRGPDLLAAALLAMLLWLLSTLIPAWRIARQDAVVSLNGSGKGTAKAGSAKSAGVLVGVQVVVSCVVLVVCINLLLAINEEASKPTGINSAHLMISTYPTEFDASHSDMSTREQYWENLTAGIKERMSGAEVAYATAAPTRPAKVPVAIEHQERSHDQGSLTLPVTAVSTNYFDLLGIHLRSGRLFDGTDNTTSADVAIVDETLANRYWPAEDAVGKRVQLSSDGTGPWLTIVGVVSAAGHEPYADETGLIYQPLRQATTGSFLLLTRLPDAAPDARARLRAAAFAVDQDLPLHNLQMLDDYLRALDMTYTALVPIFGAIAAITVILAASGLFGLISRSVARRTQEIGIRRALGGTSGRIIGMFLRQGGMYLGMGVVGGVLGLVIANLLGQSIPNILSHAVPVTGGVFLLMALVILMASYLPSRRAVVLEPADALRYE